MSSPIAPSNAIPSPVFEPGVFSRRPKAGEASRAVDPMPSPDADGPKSPATASSIAKGRGERTGGADGPKSDRLSLDTLRILQEEGPRADASVLSEAERKEVAELKQRDLAVRRHEQAHAAAGGIYAGAPSYQFEAGPDGRRYAVAGEVPIDVSPISGDPEATIRKMEQVKAAATAPLEPSGQDRNVAARANAAKAEAKAELRQQREETAGDETSRPGIDLVV